MLFYVRLNGSVQLLFDELDLSDHLVFDIADELAEVLFNRMKLRLACLQGLTKLRIEVGLSLLKIRELTISLSEAVRVAVTSRVHLV